MDVFEQAGQQYNVDPQLLRAQMQVESGGRANAVSPQGAQGPMQLMPATAKALGVSDPFDQNQAVFGAAKLMAQNLDRYGNVQDAVSAYHGGTDQANWGPKTRAYVQKVQAAYGGGNMPQNTQMPGLPPTAASAGSNDQMVDPFAGLPGNAPAQAPAQAQAQVPGMVDPFAGLDAQQSAKGGQPEPAAPQAAAPAPAQGPQGWTAPGSFLMGVGDAVRGGTQSIVHGLSWAADHIAPNSQFAQDARAALPQIDQTIANQDQQYQAQRQGGGIDWGRLGGNVVGAAPMALAAPETAPATLLGRTALGAGMGAANSLLTPVTDTSQPYAQQKFGQITTGAITGGAAAPVTSAVGGVVRGVTDPIRQRLAAAGVQMTPGQILGGALQRTEDKLTSVPVLGDMIKNAQQRSMQSFNRSAYNSALEPIGQTVPNNVGTGSAGVDYVRRQIGNVYDSLTPRANFVADQNFGNDLAGIRANLAQNAPGALPQFDNIVENQITNKLQGNALNGQQWGNTRATISGIARNQRLGNATPDNRVLADSLDDLNDAINAGVGRASPPDVLQDLNRANAAYSQYKQIERAAGMAGASNNGNVFTAAQYANAIRRGATASQKATNGGLNGQFASDATDVLGSKYPDSGTVGRSLLTLGLGAAAGHAAAPGVVVPAAVGIGLGSLPYTAPGQRMAQALLMNRPGFAAPVGNAISRYGPLLGAALAPAVSR